MVKRSAETEQRRVETALILLISSNIPQILFIFLNILLVRMFWNCYKWCKSVFQRSSKNIFSKSGYLVTFSVEKSSSEGVATWHAVANGFDRINACIFKNGFRCCKEESFRFKSVISFRRYLYNCGLGKHLFSGQIINLENAPFKKNSKW